MIKDFIPRDKILWAPFYNDGKQKVIFAEMGLPIIHEDEDFFEASKTKVFDTIIDNNPFSITNKVYRRLKEMDKSFIMISPASLLTATWFQQLFKDDLQLIIPLTRLKFTSLSCDTKCSPPPVIYYCYKMNFEKDLYFV